MSGLTISQARGSRLRILYLGLPLGALSLAQKGHQIVACGLSHAAGVGARRVRRILGAQRTLLLGAPDLHDANVQRVLASAECDVLLSWFWMRRIPHEMLEMMPRGAFGVHPSLLPRWRGPDPYFWAIRTGDVETGVTLHRLEPTYDTGAVIEQHRVAIGPTENAWQLARRLDRPSLSLLQGCAERLAHGDSLEGSTQDEASVTEAPSPTDEDLALDWNRPAEDLARLVRAAAPFPCATARLEDDVVEVVEAIAIAESPPSALHVAEAWRTNHGLAVCTGKGGLLLLRVRLDERTLTGHEITERWAP